MQHMMDLPNMSLHVILLLLLPSNVAAWHGSNRGPNDHGILQIFLHLVTVAFLQPWRRKRNHRICKLPTMDNIYIKKHFPNWKLMCFLFHSYVLSACALRVPSSLTHSVHLLETSIRRDFPHGILG